MTVSLLTLSMLCVCGILPIVCLTQTRADFLCAYFNNMLMFKFMTHSLFAACSDFPVICLWFCLLNDSPGSKIYEIS